MASREIVIAHWKAGFKTRPTVWVWSRSGGYLRVNFELAVEGSLQLKLQLVAKRGPRKQASFILCYNKSSAPVHGDPRNSTSVLKSWLQCVSNSVLIVPNGGEQQTSRLQLLGSSDYESKHDALDTRILPITAFPSPFPPFNYAHAMSAVPCVVGRYGDSLGAQEALRSIQALRRKLVVTKGAQQLGHQDVCRLRRLPGAHIRSDNSHLQTQRVGRGRCS
eukprot:1156920-Pelagomonas_calceolata.AAC.3